LLVGLPEEVELELQVVRLHPQLVVLVAVVVLVAIRNVASLLPLSLEVKS
jgi:hypothetical protein